MNCRVTLLNDHPQTPVPVIFEGICLGPNKSKKECKKRLKTDCEVKNQGSDSKEYLKMSFLWKMSKRKFEFAFFDMLTSRVTDHGGLTLDFVD